MWCSTISHTHTLTTYNYTYFTITVNLTLHCYYNVDQSKSNKPQCHHTLRTHDSFLYETRIMDEKLEFPKNQIEIYRVAISTLSNRLWNKICNCWKRGVLLEMAECVVVKFSSESVRVRTEEVGNNVSDEGHIQTTGSVFGVYHIVCLLLSITTFALDVGFDSWLAYFYYRQGQGAYFALTLTFLIFPALITTAFSLRWYVISMPDVWSI